MASSEILRQNYIDYLLYLDDGGERFKVEEERVHYEGLIHASALMDCPLKAASERSGEVEVFPQFGKKANPSIMHRMQLGVRSAEAFQESLLYKNSLDMTWSAGCEKTVFSDDWKLQGRYDALVHEYKGRPDLDTYTVIEIKHRMPTWKDKMPMPRLGDVFQMLAYMVMLEAEGKLVILNTPAFKDFYNPSAMMEIWTLKPQDQGYVLVSEHGYNWQDPHNDATFINIETLKQEIQRQLRYLNGEKTPPIDLMDRDNSWQCCSIKRYPKDGGKGIMMPSCAHWCHSDPQTALEGIEYTQEEGVIYAY